MFSLYKKIFMKKRSVPSVTFATSVYERDWEVILKDPFYLKEYQIASHMFDFQERLLIINNVEDLIKVLSVAKKKIKEDILTKIISTKELEEKVLSFFHLSKEELKVDRKRYPNICEEWVYFNALPPLSAIYSCQTDYLLFMTGDSYLEKSVDWIEKAIRTMEKNPQYKVANLVWDNKYQEVKKQSYKKIKNFFVAKEGFSDQMFLIKTKDFQKPIYNEIREDSHHFPRGDVFEKRVFSYLKNRGYERIIYRYGSYIHKNIGS